MSGTFLLLAAVMLHVIPASLLWSRPSGLNNPEKQADPQPGVDHGKPAGECVVDCQVAKESGDGNANGHANYGYDGEDEARAVSSGNTVQSDVHSKKSETELANDLAVQMEYKAKETRVQMVHTHKDIKQGVSNKGVLKNFFLLAMDPRLIFYEFGLATSFCALLVFTGLLEDIYVDRGLTEDDSTLTVTLVNMFSLIGRVMPGLLSQFSRVKAMWVSILGAVICGMAIITVAAVRTRVLIILAFSLSGVSLGISLARGVTLLDIIEPDKLATALGVIETTGGIGNLVAGPLAGKRIFLYMYLGFITYLC